MVKLTSELKVLTTSDGPALLAVCLAFEDLMAARVAIQREGRFYSVTTKSGGRMKRAHPAVRVGAEAWRRYVTGLSLFGLAPSLRTKVQTAPGDERDDVDLWLLEGGKKHA